jgi:hypothetical protein
MCSLSSQILCTLNLSDVTYKFHVVTMFVRTDLQRKMLLCRGMLCLLYHTFAYLSYPLIAFIRYEDVAEAEGSSYMATMLLLDL